MKPKEPLLISCPPRHAAQAPFGGLAETGAGGVRCLLVPILLNGGFGYGNLRLHAPLAVDAAQHSSSDDNYPPCNVEQLGEDRYQISLALAGFAPDEIGITAEQNVLTVEGRKAAQAQREFLYQGIFRGRSSGSSTWPTTSRSEARHSTMGCCTSNWSARFRKR